MPVMLCKPLQNHIYVKKDAIKTETSSGIVFPESCKVRGDKVKLSMFGTVIAMGDGCITLLNIRVGDKVMFGKLAGIPFQYEGETLHLMLIEEITAIIFS